jgi:hypothetical protein
MPPAGPRRPLEIPEALSLVARAHARCAILVEGWSDETAVETLARRDGIDLAARRVVILPVGGVTNLARFAAALAAPGIGVRLGGLYDASDEALALRGLARAGLGTGLTRAAAQRAGFFLCDNDLEDELIRALGPHAVERLLLAQDELSSFRRFQGQPAQLGRDAPGQLKRFMGTRAGRKIRYGALLVEALDPARVPPPLRSVLAHALG